MSKADPFISVKKRLQNKTFSCIKTEGSDELKHK